jgi:dethiobiotin synthetase
VAAIFVTGTGTDIGKTFVTAALIRHLRTAGRAGDAIKPVVSGFDPADAAASDPGVLLDALGLAVTPEEIERIAPWRFAAPLSPDLAARAEGRTLDFNALVRFSDQALAQTRDFLFIEGVGGVMVPLDDRHTVLDWMSALRIPLLLVGGSYLGAISHALTALHVVAGRKLEIAAVAVSESEPPGAALDDTVATIARFAAPIEVIGVPRLAPGTGPHPAIARLAQLIELA